MCGLAQIAYREVCKGYLTNIRYRNVVNPSNAQRLKCVLQGRKQGETNCGTGSIS